jgi:copper chaperone CopZ
MRTLTLLALALATTAAAQDKKPSKPERITYRVTGLFDASRETVLREALAELPDLTLIDINFAEAEVTLEFDPQKLFPGQKPERVTELVSDKVRAATHHTFAIKPRRTIARDKLEAVTIPAFGCDCKACCLAAYEAVAAVDGVYQATASFKDSRVTALFDPTKTDRAKLEEALRKKGVDLGKPKP